MIYITKADQTTHVETEIYRLGVTDGFYNIKINEKVNDYGSMTFSCIPSVANFKLNDIITVYKNGSVYWQGIIVSMTRDFYGNVNVTCYSMLWTLTFNYLSEKAYNNTDFGTIITDIQYRDGHDIGSGAAINTQYGWSVTFDNPSDPGYTPDGIVLPFGSTLSQIMALCEPYSYIYPTYYAPFGIAAFDLHIADYLYAMNVVNQPIEFGLNLLDYAEENSIANYITSVAPLGNGNLTVGAFNGTITFNGQSYSVNQNGSGYIKNPTPGIITEYGERRARVNFDINNVNDLMAAGVNWLENNAFSELTITLSAADLSIISSLNYDEFKLGYCVNIKATPFGLATTMPILERNIDLQDPSKSTITISNTYQTTLTEIIRGN